MVSAGPQDSKEIPQSVVTTKSVTTTTGVGAIRLALSGPLRGMAAYRQFVFFKLSPSTSRPGKQDKLPCDFRGKVVSAHDSQHWMSADEALAVAELYSPDLGVGFVFTAADPFFFLDMDGSLSAAGWSPLAMSLFQALSGCAAEISGSGSGGHIFGSGVMPAHGCRNQALGLELYTESRFVALTGTGALGDCLTDCSAVLPALVAQYFPADSAIAASEWSDQPVPEWRGPTDDAELIRRAMRPSANAAFGGRASFSDLWTANEAALAHSYPEANGRPYDASSADAALAQHLAFWTGNDCERIARLMRQSALQRDKYEREDYLPRTIQGAVGRQENVLGDKVPTVASGATPVTGALTVPSGAPSELTPDDFFACLPLHGYINRRTRAVWEVGAVDGCLARFKESACQSMKPSRWLDLTRAVTQMSWHPGQPEVIEGKISVDGILKNDAKGKIYNLYRPSDAVASDADPSIWVSHLRKLYPEEAEYLIKWFAWRIQNPEAKINHAIVLGGTHGIGKDFLIEPIRYAAGAGNFEDIEYADLFNDYTEWAERTLLVVNEARGADGINRYDFYEKSKRLIAGPPDTLPCRKLYQGRYYVPNVLAVVITSNNKLNGLHIDPEDRRYYVAWSKAEKNPTAYNKKIWEWMREKGGKQAVLGYLRHLEISDFEPMGDPPKTEAWRQIVEAGRNPEEKDLSDSMVDEQGHRLQIATVKEIIVAAQFRGQIDLSSMLMDKKNARKIPQMLERIGFEALHNPFSPSDGRWVIAGKRETLYVDRNLSPAERMALANKKVTDTAPMRVVE
jgi:hypothetical protein